MQNAAQITTTHCEHKLRDADATKLKLVNAALLAASILAGQDDNVRAALDAWRARQTAAVGERPVDDA